MTEIDLHIVARMADYMDTHPYPFPLGPCCVSLARLLARFAYRLGLFRMLGARRGSGGVVVHKVQVLPCFPASRNEPHCTVCFHIIGNIETMHD